MTWNSKHFSYRGGFDIDAFNGGRTPRLGNHHFTYWFKNKWRSEQSEFQISASSQLPTDAIETVFLKDVIHTQMKSPTHLDQLCCCLTVVCEACSFLAALRVWFNGRMKASQALDGGSIPLTRFRLNPSQPGPFRPGLFHLSVPS